MLPKAFFVGSYFLPLVHQLIKRIELEHRLSPVFTILITALPLRIEPILSRVSAEVRVISCGKGRHRMDILLAAVGFE